MSETIPMSKKFKSTLRGVLRDHLSAQAGELI